MGVVTSLGYGTPRAEREREKPSSSVEPEMIPAAKKEGQTLAVQGGNPPNPPPPSLRASLVYIQSHVDLVMYTTTIHSNMHNVQE